MSRLLPFGVCAALLTVSAARAQLPLLIDGFGDYERGRLFDLTWQTDSGEWRVEAGQLVGRSLSRGVCRVSASPISGSQELAVLITPREALAKGGWPAASLVLWSNEADYWRLALVQGLQGEHYAELVEMRGGKWQAQIEPPTRLDELPGRVGGFDWQFGRTYRCRLAISAERIAGEIVEDATGEVLFRRGHALSPDADAVRRGRPALMVDAMGTTFDDLRVVGSVDQPSARGTRVAILDTEMPDSSPEVMALVHAALAADGTEATVLRLPSAPGEFSVPEDTALLILPHTRRLPLGVAEGVDRYLRRGGNAIFLGGPFGEQTLVARDGAWLPLTEALAKTPTEHPLIDLRGQSLDTWRRFHSPDEGEAAKALDERGPPGGGPAMRVQLENLRSWDTLGHQFAASPFAEGETLTAFRAKGGPKTSHLTFEWVETDGSRWMATVPLTREWRRYVLQPQDFVYWQDNPARGRGGPGDCLRPENATRLAIGLAKSHSPIPDGPHAYWIADIGAARPPFRLTPDPPPIIEAISPAYKSFQPGAVRQIAAAGDQALVDPDLRLPAPTSMRCALARTRGLGLKGARYGRWMPLLTATDAGGAHRDCVASLYASLTEPYPNAAWGVIGIEDASYLARHQAQVGPVIAAMARWLLGGVYLVKAGADRFGYLPEERPIVGGQVVNRSGDSRELRLEVTVAAEGRQTAAFTRSWPVSAGPGALTGMSDVWDGAVEPGVYVVQVGLRVDGRLVDTVSQELVRLPKLNADPSQFVVVRDGDFRLSGSRWHPHGINYWPSNATGLEPAAYWLHWLHPANYDPAVINRDLQALADLRINSVSILLGDREQLPAALHFLYRCSQHGIRANVFLGGGAPVGFDAEHAAALIREGRLAENPAIWAWDIAWEPHWGAYEARKAIDPQWAAWIGERYGTVANAERDWGCPAPRTPEGAITGPSQEQILNDGEHRVMVAAYRRFLDDLTSDCYGRWARAVHEVDPRHLIGARSGYGGTGQPGIDPQMPFDLLSGARHLDFISPEGYGLGGPWESFEQGGFTAEYARYAGSGKPVFWAEIGLSVHPGASPEQLGAQRQLYEHLYRMVLWSGASGSAGWWFPGGFRVGENSDYGIMDPDGSPRPSALEARKWAERVAQYPGPTPPNTWIAIDRDLHPRGYSQVWLTHRDEFVRLRRQGRMVGLRTEGTGTDSTNTPLVAVGNTPADGTNPPKYLNAEFGFVRLRAGGEWVDVASGSAVEVPRGPKVELSALVGNTGEALWASPARAGARPGGVYLVSAPGSGVDFAQPLPGDVARYAETLVGPFVLCEGVTEETPVALRMEARGRTPFGAYFRLTLRPR
jgi:hypothetical protein